MKTMPALCPPLSLAHVGAGRRLELAPDMDQRRAVARWLGILELPELAFTLAVAPAIQGWRLSGHVRAVAIQACGLTLEPVTQVIDEAFGMDLIEDDGRSETGELDLTPDDDAPEPIHDGRIELGQLALEHLALALDPFPRKPGAEFEPPVEAAEISPFAVLKSRMRTDPET